MKNMKTFESKHYNDDESFNHYVPLMDQTNKFTTLSQYDGIYSNDDHVTTPKGPQINMTTFNSNEFHRNTIETQGNTTEGYISTSHNEYVTPNGLLD